MVFRTTPQLGPQLDDVIPVDGVYFDAAGSVMSPKLGARETGSDGHEYVLVKASSAINAASAPGTQVSITEPDMTAAAGAGGFYAPVAGVAKDAYFWARKGAL